MKEFEVFFVDPDAANGNLTRERTVRIQAHNKSEVREVLDLDGFWENQAPRNDDGETLHVVTTCRGVVMREVRG